MDIKLNRQELPEIAKEIYGILSNFFFDLESYRAINEYLMTLSPSDPSKPLWIILSNNSLMMATVEWCKVFGSARNNTTHYTKCIEILEGIEETVNDMKEFRDKYISHNDHYNKPVPIMEKAVTVVKTFDKAMIEKYGLEYQESTLDVITNYREEIRKCLSTIISRRR